ncbi:response regulator transcription factor [Patescibacteria group bacterium]
MPKSKSQDNKNIGETHTIVLVEDDSFLAGMYVAKLEMEKFRVHLAGDGNIGLKKIVEIKPDIILLDIVLPKMDGFAVLEKIKKEKDLKNIPVILLTNLGQRDDVEKGLALGASDYLIKAHFMPSEVIDKIKRLVSSK